MGAFADLSQILNTMTGGTGAKEQVFWYIDSRVGGAAATAPAAGQVSSLWTYNKTTGAGVAAGGTARTCTSATAGAIPITNASGGRQKYFLGTAFAASQIGAYIIHDRICDISGLDGTLTSAQTITGLSDTRYSGAGVQAWVEIYTIVGSVTTTLTISYTNQDGTSGRTSKAVVFGGTGRREVTRAIHIPLADGDTGVQSVQSVTVAASTGSAGNFGITLKKPITFAPVGVGSSGLMIDLISQLPSMPLLVNDVCLGIDFYSAGTGAPTMIGTFVTGEA